MQRTRECLHRLIISNVQYKPFTRSRRALYRSLPNPPGLPPDVPVSDAPVSSKSCSPIIERIWTSSWRRPYRSSRPATIQIFRGVSSSSLPCNERSCSSTSKGTRAHSSSGSIQSSHSGEWIRPEHSWQGGSLPGGGPRDQRCSRHASRQRVRCSSRKAR